MILFYTPFVIIFVAVCVFLGNDHNGNLGLSDLKKTEPTSAIKYLLAYMIGCFVGFTKVKSHPASCSFYLHGPLDTVNSDVSMACLSVNTMLSNNEPQVNVLFYWISQKNLLKLHVPPDMKQLYWHQEFMTVSECLNWKVNFFSLHITLCTYSE